MKFIIALASIVLLNACTTELSHNESTGSCKGKFSWDNVARCGIKFDSQSSVKQVAEKAKQINNQDEVTVHRTKLINKERLKKSKKKK